MKAPVAVSVNISLHTPDEIFYELHREGDACDVIVRMDDKSVYTATFVTINYLHRQMDLSFQVTHQLPDAPAVRYAVIDTTHIIVELLDKATIEDTIDNLIALDVFESYFIRVTDEDSTEDTRTNSDGRRATKEVAAVVISDVLVVQQ